MTSGISVYSVDTARGDCQEGILIKTTLLRAISNSLTTLLLMASYLWGGCISCEQFFMLPGAKSDCCDRNKCKKSPKQSKPESSQQDCQRMPLEQASGSHPVGIAPLVAALVIDSAVQVFYIAEPILDPIADSPPDLPILNTSLLL